MLIISDPDGREWHHKVYCLNLIFIYINITYLPEILVNNYKKYVINHKIN